MKLEFRKLCFDIRAEDSLEIGKKYSLLLWKKVQQLEIRSEQTIHSESPLLHGSFQGLHSLLP